MYSKIKMDSYFYSMPGFYIFFIPAKVPYKKIYSEAINVGLKKKQEFGPILESGSLFGQGWIGIEVEKPTSSRVDVKHIVGEFSVYEHKGPFKNIGKSCKKIRKDNPNAKEFFNLYLDDPDKTAPAELRTQILFR